MTVEEVRKRYLEFFATRGHAIIPSAPIVPENDPTTLFTSSGMQPLVPYLLGQEHPEGTRLANSQLSFRAGDIEEVGDNRHTTFFEMLGNWSLGDYFKKEQLPWLFEFLTKEVNIDPNKLYATVFIGDKSKGIPQDTESAGIWQKLFAEKGIDAATKEIGSESDGYRLGMGGARIFYYDAKKNWWSRSGVPENMPAGGPDVFAIDVFDEMISHLEHHSGKKYEDSRFQRSFRIIADHIRAATIILGDGVRPSNTDRGYVLRRLLRRAAQHAMKLDVASGQGADSILNTCAVIVMEKYGQAYPELAGDEAYQHITGEIWKEEKQFAHTLEKGMKEFEKMTAGNHITGQEAFTLFTTYGFPFEMTLEIARERGIEVDEDEFKALMKRHQEQSRAGGEQKFRGGLADHAEATVRLHTAHHLLLAALQKVLGSHVHQRGSNITQERLRIDFSHGEKLTKEQFAAVEALVNEKIQEELPVFRTEMAKEQAESLGAEKEFGAKYADMVNVYSIGPRDATREYPKFDHVFSIEFCGGPHVQNTRELKGPGGTWRCKIQKRSEEHTSELQSHVN